MITCELNPEVRIADEKAGVVEYIASDQSMDAEGDVIRQDGWLFDRFSRNAPLVDSHKYGSIGNVLGKVLDFRVENRRLIETAQWAIDVPENTAAKVGYAMTKAGYLKAVSVGFLPTLVLTRVAQDDWPEDWGNAQILPAQSRPGKALWSQQMKELGIAESGRQPKTIFVQQQQTELSVCVMGVNMNALAKCYKEGVLTDPDLEWISTERSKRETAGVAKDSSAAALARQRKRESFLDALNKTIKKI
jgi:hypothetical protein